MSDDISVKQEGVILRMSINTDAQGDALVYEIKSQMQDAEAGWCNDLVGVTIKSYSSSPTNGVSIVFVITEGFTKYENKVKTLKDLMLECDDFLYKKLHQPKKLAAKPPTPAPAPVKQIVKHGASTREKLHPKPTSFTLRGGDDPKPKIVRRLGRAK